MKKIITVIIITAFMFSLPVAAREAAEYTIPDVGAYVLIEAVTGEILYAHNENEQLPVSSLGKIELLLRVTEKLQAGNISLDDIVPAPDTVMRAKSPVIWLDPGETMTVEDLMKSVIMASSNDAAMALAEYIGLEYTDDPHSSAYELALLTAELFSHADKDDFPLAEYYTKRLCAVRPGTERETQLVNTNAMVQWYQGIIGGKAGHSAAAGFCTANCAERGDMKLVAVVLGAGDKDERFSLAEHLLDSGFKNFEYVTPDVDTSEFSPVKVLRGVEKLVEAAPDCSMTFIAPRGEGGRAKFEFVLPESIAAPVEAGQVLGTVTIRLGERVVARCDIVALHAVEELTFWKSLSIITEKFFRV